MAIFKCKICGGSLEIDGAQSFATCEYCGTQYKEHNDSIIRIETFQNPVRTFKACVTLEDMPFMSAEEFSQIAITQLTHKLAEAIAPMMEVHCERDPFRMTHRVAGRIKIIQPVHTANWEE